jgi:hypothetical protein
MTMPAMHERMHDGAGENKQVWERSGYVYQMLFQQKVTGNGPDHEQADRIT